MRISKAIKFALMFLLTIINYTHSEITWKEFYEFVETLGSGDSYDVNPKVIVFCKIIPRKKKSERRKLDYLGNVLKTFLSNMNINSIVENIENRHYIAVISRKDQNMIDKKLILEQFKDLINDISILPPDAFKKKDENRPNIEL